MGHYCSRRDRVCLTSGGHCFYEKERDREAEKKRDNKNGKDLVGTELGCRYAR